MTVGDGGKITADEAIERLRRGNERFLSTSTNQGDTSASLVSELAAAGQHPFATVLACADSRVVPEHVFSCGLGEVFTMRVAGNVACDGEVASAVYACGHLHTPLLLVLGHTGCGAVEAAMAGGDHGAVNAVTRHIEDAIGDECDPYAASVLNAQATADELSAQPELAALVAAGELAVRVAVYHTDTGAVEFL